MNAEKVIGAGVGNPKFISLEEAAELVFDGCTLALGGLTLYRRPVAFVRALLRRVERPRNLTLLSFTGGFESDVLIGAGCVDTVRSVYFGLESFGLAPMFTDGAAKQAFHIREETEASIAMGLRARAAGVGFMPSRAWLGTDLFKLRPDVKTIIDPYTGETLTAFPSISVDVVVLHALEADQHGNVKLNNNLGIDLDLVYVANTVIVTTECMVEQVERSIDGSVIPAPGTTHIVLAEHGAYPTSCYPLYPVGGGALLNYIEACSGGRFDAYLEKWLRDENNI